MASKLIHITDLYHPHADPDDHYDLAQVFALAKSGAIQLEQVMIDHSHRGSGNYSPALFAVYQLNHLTGQNVHVTLGADTGKFVGNPQLWKAAPKNEVWAAEKIIEILEQSDDKVYITIVGGCLDTAIALERAPEVFREKCAGIVLNAGTSHSSREKLEYNVALGPLEYSKIFRAPCPVYWNPCFRSPDRKLWSGENATFYVFKQKEVFPYLSDRLMNYFLYMLNKCQDTRFLQALEQPISVEEVEKYGNLDRNMWCTGSIFDLAGKTVTMDGEVVNKEETDTPIFEYKPIRVACEEDGFTTWSFDNTSQDRFLFHINDLERYQMVMPKALAAILKEI